MALFLVFGHFRFMSLYNYNEVYLVEEVDFSIWLDMVYMFLINETIPLNWYKYFFKIIYIISIKVLAYHFLLALIM